MKAKSCLLTSLSLYLLLLLGFQSAYAYNVEIHCKAITISKEASGEGLLGMRAVLDTLETRIKKNNSSCVKEVSLPGQWSWYSSQTKKGIPLKATQKQLTYYKRVVRMESVVRATHFHNKKYKPKWRLKLKFVKQVRNHVFYR